MDARLVATNTYSSCIANNYWQVWKSQCFNTHRYEQYGLQYPDHKLFEHHPTINSELLHYLKLGRIKPHCDIAKFSHDNTVEFTDGSQAEFDTVIFCTGYYTSIPLLKQYLTFENQVPNLINGIFVPKLRNVYYFGFGQAR